MKNFMDKDFLLSNDTAKMLYHNYAEPLPIIDYHCHVNPKDIAQDTHYSNITELWLGGDHYKWRAMRSCGVDEKYITGDASDYDKFKSFAQILPDLIGNPIYHWSHLELQRYFDYYGVLNAKTCDEVWALTSEKLRSSDMSVRNLIVKSNCEALCTTDDPVDTLEYHKEIASDKGFSVKVLPAFRPDKGINLNRSAYRDYIAKLSQASGVKIKDFESLKQAYQQRIDYFDSMGCRTADHGIDNYVSFAMPKNNKEIDDIFKKALANDGRNIDEYEAKIFKTAMNRFFAREYKNKGWVMQFHFGVIRNTNTVRFKALGPDSGFDVIGSDTGVNDLARLLDQIEIDGGLPRTILYSINPSDNAALGALIGAFQRRESGMSTYSLPLLQHGSAWWFNDNESGMREQLTSLANLSALGKFVGMLTDSRSFLSYTRHEYFRRILCDLIGHWVESGRYPNDREALEKIISDICYYNTRNFFNL